MSLAYTSALRFIRPRTGPAASRAAGPETPRKAALRLAARDGPIAGHDLRLEREDVPALRVDEDLQPLDVVGVARRRLVVAERLDTREVVDPLPVLVEQRFVDARVVRVAVHVGDWLPPLDDEVAQRRQPLVEP